MSDIQQPHRRTFSVADFDDDELRVFWAALRAMVRDDHAAQDTMTEAQWDVAEGWYLGLTAEADRRWRFDKGRAP